MIKEIFKNIHIGENADCMFPQLQIHQRKYNYKIRRRSQFYISVYEYLTSSMKQSTLTIIENMPVKHCAVSKNMPHAL